MSELESELRVLLDKQALYELVMRYARAVDRNDKEMLLACFHPDAFLHYNTYQGPAVDFYEQIWAATERGEGGIPRGQHVVTNALFEVRGDVGYGESYLEGIRAGVGSIRASDGSQASGPGFPIERIGRFIDRFERRDGEWRIVSRRVAMEWLPEEMDESPLGPGGYKLSNFAPTRYDDGDPSYERNWGDDV